MSLKSLPGLLGLSFLLTLAACAPVSTLPRAASQANFDPSVGGRTGWSEYEEVYMVYDTDLPTAFQAAKSGLTGAGFAIKEASLDKLYAIGEHGIIAYDWHLFAGVYLKPLPTKDCFGGIPCIAVKIQIEGGKSEGFWMWGKGARPWPQKIFDGMNDYLQTQAKAAATRR